jgi:Na+-translocating ferredoxin:NAD+ oxidoreductase RnfC subunit
MKQLMTSPLLRQMEINRVSEIIDGCESIEDTALAAKAIDALEENQPNEREVIQIMRDDLCDLTFKYFLIKYPNTKA